MDPKRAARRLATLGCLILLLAFLLRGISLALTINAARIAFAPPPGETTLPAVGHYTLAADSKQILFEQQYGNGLESAWFSIPIEGGVPARIAKPEVDPYPFNLRDGHLYRWVGDGYSLSSGSPPDMTVGVHATAPNDKMIAFGAFRPGRDGWSLFILTDAGQLDWLGDFPSLSDLDWSPDEKQLAFVAPAEGVEQIFTIDRAGQNLRQVTRDPGRKSEPRWSPDGRQMAYLAAQETEPAVAPSAESSQVTPTTDHLLQSTPEPSAVANATSAPVEIALINADGSAKHLLTNDPRQEYNLFWLRTEQGPRLAYTARLTEQPQLAYLYALDPQSSQPRRLYPPLALDSFSCPARLPLSGAEANARAVVTNSALAKLHTPLLMRSGRTAFALVGPRDTGQQRAQTLDILGGESATTDWPLRSAGGLATHVSLMINLGDPFPMDEKHCVILNTSYLSLPNLHFLPIMPLLAIAGMLLCLPWLRHRRSRWLWAAWTAVPLVYLLLIAIETGWIYRSM